MVRILHRSKVYSLEYYLSCIFLGIAVCWAESIIIWMTLPYNISFQEVIKFNFFAMIIGALTGILVSLLGKVAYILFKKKIEFSHQVHQTSWIFSIAVSIYYDILVIGGLLGNRILNIVLALAFTPLVFILIYLITSRFLFRMRVAGRLSIEIFLTLILIIYLIRHPGLSKEIPFTPPSHPHFFVFNISDLIDGDQGMWKLASCFPSDKAGSLNYFPHTYPVSMRPDYNISEVFSLELNDKSSNIFTDLEKYGYHTGYFSLKSLQGDNIFNAFDIVDDQSNALGTKLKEIHFYSNLLFFLDMGKFISKLDNENYSEGIRTPSKMLSRMINWIKQERDEEPFFIVIQYAFNPLKSENPDFNGEIALKSALYMMDKSTILDHSVIFFTSLDSLSQETPVYIYNGGFTGGEVFSKNIFSQKDIAGTIISLFTNSEKSTEYSWNVNRLLLGDTFPARLVYTWKDKCGEGQSAERVAYYPWILDKSLNSELNLKSLEEYRDPPEILEQKKQRFLITLSKYLETPHPQSVEIDSLSKIFNN